MLLYSWASTDRKQHGDHFGLQVQHEVRMEMNIFALRNSESSNGQTREKNGKIMLKSV